MGDEAWVEQRMRYCVCGKVVEVAGELGPTCLLCWAHPPACLRMPACLACPPARPAACLPVFPSPPSPPPNLQPGTDREDGDRHPKTTTRLPTTRPSASHLPNLSRHRQG